MPNYVSKNHHLVLLLAQAFCRQGVETQVAACLVHLMKVLSKIMECSVRNLAKCLLSLHLGFDSSFPLPVILTFFLCLLGPP